METSFWEQKWKDGEIGFHREDFHPYLIEFESTIKEFVRKINSRKDSIPSALIPLCGKSKDLIWTSKYFKKIDGIEISTLAIEQFFQENFKKDKMKFYKGKKGNFKKYSVTPSKESSDFSKFQGEINLYEGDYFKINELVVEKEIPESYHFIFDRASLVALPREMRKNYFDITQKLLAKSPLGLYLLSSFEYDQTRVDGPPFSVEEKEIRSHYSEKFGLKVELKKEEKTEIKGPKFTEAGIVDFIQKAYLITAQ